MTIKEKEELQRRITEIRSCFDQVASSLEKKAEQYRSISGFCDFFLARVGSSEPGDYESLLKYLEEEYKNLIYVRKSN